MEEKKENNMCNGQCSKCSFQQRIYCASYLSRNNYAMIESLLSKINAIQASIDDIRNRVNEMQPQKENLSSHLQEKKQAQRRQAVQIIDCLNNQLNS